MKKVYLAVIITCLTAAVYAQAQTGIPAGRSFFHEKVDIDQRNIAKLPGFSTDLNASATAKIDSLQSFIEADDQLDNTNKIKFLRGLDEALNRYISGCKSGSYPTSILPALVNVFKECIHPELNKQSIAGIISRNNLFVGEILMGCFAYQDNVGAADIKNVLLVMELQQDLRPVRVMDILSRHTDLPGIDSIIVKIARIDPEIVYNYAAATNNFGNKIQANPDKLVKIISRLARMNTGRQFFPFLDELYDGKMSFEQVDTAVQDNGPKYYKLLVKTEIDYADKTMRGQPVLTKAEMDGKISDKARELYINTINALHERPDAERFRAIENLTPQELYYLAVSSEEEIYTSSYVRGVYPKVFRNKNTRGDSLLMSVRFDHFKKWIKMAANYNDLDDFLGRMDKESAQVLMKAFVKGLDKAATLEDAVDVANSYSSITDKAVQKLVLNEVQYSLQKAKQAGNTKGTNIYSILNILFLSMDSTNRIDVTKLLGIPPVFYMPNKELQDTAGKIIVQQFFYGDDDGRAGFAQFMSLFDNSNWSVKSNDKWVVHTSTGKGTRVVIYSNRPLDEKQGLDDKAQEALTAYLNEHGIDPTIVIHRGHSYYLNSTLQRLANTAKIVVLGSCGAYQSLNKVLTTCPTAHIVSSKQTGSQSINGPLIKGMMETLRQGKTLNWPVLWANLGKQGLDKELFNDYVPPYKNLGALFIMAYNRMAK